MSATGAHFQQDDLVISLSDGREIVLPLHRYKWLAWLERATPQQREHWSLEPEGYALYWEELDDGIEVEHLLSLDSLG
jgi:Protein of unknown function (DUF2442)